MMQRIAFKWVVCAALAAGFCFPADAGVTVKIKFSKKTKKNLSKEDMDAIVEKVKEKFKDFGDVTIVTEGKADLTLETFYSTNSAAWGKSWKKSKYCRIYLKNNSKSKKRRKAFDTDAKKRNQWGETAAHEIGHLLCAVHNCDKPPTLMTKGQKVNNEQRAANDRSFTDDNAKKIKSGIKKLTNKESWNLDAKYDECCDVSPVRGVVDPSPEGLHHEDQHVSFTAALSHANFSVGFINDVEEFVEIIPPGQGEGVMGFDAGEFANFALRLEDQVFPFDRNRGEVIPSLPRPPELAYELGLDQQYYGKLELVFFDVMGQDVILTLDADVFGETDGFSLAPPLWVPWVESFEVYTSGQGIHGREGWRGWDDNPDFDAVVSDQQDYDGSLSLLVEGDADIVHEFSNMTSGQWTLRALTYVPSDMTGRQYFVVLTDYVDGGPNHWTVQTWFDVAEGVVHHDFTGDELPLITDEWVELRVEIDLDADAKNIYYDDQLLATESWTCEGCFEQERGLLNIAAIDLFANGGSGMYFDLLTLEPFSAREDICDPCDANCDGSVDLTDVEPFIELILGGGDPCDTCSGDTNGDGSVDLTDVEGFIGCLLG